jgi:hypothetical protein
VLTSFFFAILSGIAFAVTFILLFRWWIIPIRNKQDAYESMLKTYNTSHAQMSRTFNMLATKVSEMEKTNDHIMRLFRSTKVVDLLCEIVDYKIKKERQEHDNITIRDQEINRG